MPRPKRTKVATAAPTRVAQQPQRRNAPRTTRQATEGLSDDSLGFVKTSAKGRQRRGAARGQEEEYLMTGGLGDVETGDVHEAARGKELTVAARDRNPKDSEAPDAISASTKLRRSSGRTRRDQTSTTVTETATVSSPGRSPQNAEDTLGTSTLLSSPLQTPGGTVRGSPPVALSALKKHNTPAIDGSLIALTKFKRRPRQPSILRMVQQTSDPDVSDEELDDFNPDDESTPLNVRKNQVSQGLDGDANVPSSASKSSGSRKRKLASPVLQVPRSSPPPSSPPLSVLSSPPPSEPSSLPEAASNEHRGLHGRGTPDNWSDTMAPPKSSTSIEDIDVGRKEYGHGKPSHARNRTDHALDSEGALSNIDVAQGRRGPTRNARKKQTQPRVLSTAALQSLLPRRRQQNRARKEDSFDVPSSTDLEELGSDEDELQAPISSSRRSRAPRKNNGSMAKDVLRKQARVAATAKKHTSSAVKKTYGRRALSDKENDGSYVAAGESDDDANGNSADAGSEADQPPPVAVPKSKELEEAARKFAEIDQWDLEFETVDLGGGSSSPWR